MAPRSKSLEDRSLEGGQTLDESEPARSCEFMNKLFKDEPVVLVDAYAWIFRAYYALPDFRNSAGQPTSVVHGFLSTLPKLVAFATKTCGATAELAIFFDRGGSQDRLAVYADYKSNRRETPEDLKIQVPLIEEALLAMSLPQVAINGVEADDVIASVAQMLAKQGRRVMIASNDKDFFQILSDQISIVRATKRGEDVILYDRKTLKEKFGLEPESMVDYYALVGDAVDHIPGVKGVGDKTACKLLKQFGTLAGIYENLDRIQKTTSKILDHGRKEAYLSRNLVKLRTDLQVDVTPVPFDPARFDRSKLVELLSRLELHRLADRLLGSAENQD